MAFNRQNKHKMDPIPCVKSQRDCYNTRLSLLTPNVEAGNSSLRLPIGFGVRLRDPPSWIE